MFLRSVLFDVMHKKYVILNQCIFLTLLGLSAGEICQLLYPFRYSPPPPNHGPKFTSFHFFGGTFGQNGISPLYE